MEVNTQIKRLQQHVQNNSWISTALLCLWCLIIFVLSSISGNHYPKVSWAFADKMVHLSLYFWLGVFAWIFFKQRDRGMPTALAFGVLFGLSDEIHQVWVPRRSASFADLIADACGVALGLLTIGLILYFQNYRGQSERAVIAKPVDRMEIS